MDRQKICGMISLLCSVIILLCTSSCIKSYKLAPSETPQGKEHNDKRVVVKNNLRTTKIYNQWETLALFDVLWLSEQTRKSYVDTYCMRRGKDEHAQDAMLQRQMEDNEHWISFYVLADIRDPHRPSLSDSHAAWTMYLDNGNKGKVLPESIKEVELEPEILNLFGHRFASPKFKTAYLVKFPAKSVGGEPYLSADKPFKMVMSSVTRQCELGWQGGHPVVVKKINNGEAEQEKLVKDEDYYWL